MDPTWRPMPATLTGALPPAPSGLPAAPAGAAVARVFVLACQIAYLQAIPACYAASWANSPAFFRNCAGRRAAPLARFIRYVSPGSERETNRIHEQPGGLRSSPVLFPDRALLYKRCITKNRTQKLKKGTSYAPRKHILSPGGHSEVPERSLAARRALCGDLGVRMHETEDGHLAPLEADGP